MCLWLLNGLNASGQFGSVSRFNRETQTYETCDLTGGNNFPIVAGEGYVVRMESGEGLSLWGEVVCPASLELFAGLNLIGHPTPPEDLSCYDLLDAFGESVISSIQRFNTTTGSFETCGYYNVDGTGTKPVGIDFPIVSGEGYMVYAKEDRSVELPGCGESLDF
jgi:hypothetical protein